MKLVREPIYQQLTQALRGLIRNGEFKGGTKFLTEREVTERFKISRTTANKALSSLVSEGILEFKKGVGTFVRNGLLDYDLKSLVSFTSKAQAVNKMPSTKVIKFCAVEVRNLEDDVRKALDLPKNEKVFYMERLRLADSKPVILEHRYVVAGLCPDLQASDLSGSLYSLWIQHYKLDIAGADQVIRAINIQGKWAQLLDVPDGSAGLAIKSTGYLVNNEPLWWEHTIYRGDAYEFRNYLGGIMPARPGTGVLY